MSIFDLCNSTIYSTFSTLYWNTAFGAEATISSLRISSITSDLPIYITAPDVFISSLRISSINGLSIFDLIGTSTLYSTFSTVYWSTAYGLNTNTTYANISTMLISTIMGDDLPILAFDRVNRRVGVNLGAVQQPRATLDVNGTVYANNFVTTSDRRLKKNISQLGVPRDIPASYRFQYTESDEWDIGCLADEIESIAPECVYTAPNGYKAVAYAKLVPMCLSLIRDLTERMEALEKRV
jgi:hypothetical protein